MRTTVLSRAYLSQVRIQTARSAWEAIPFCRYSVFSGKSGHRNPLQHVRGVPQNALAHKCTSASQRGCFGLPSCCWCKKAMQTNRHQLSRSSSKPLNLPGIYPLRKTCQSWFLRDFKKFWEKFSS